MNLLSNIQKSSLLTNTIKMSVGNILMYLLPFIVTPILTRLYSPKDFGEWGIFSGFISIASVGLLLCMENAIIKAKDQRETSVISLLCLVIGLSLTAVISILFITGRYYNIKFFATFPDTHLLFLYLICYVVYTIIFNIANKAEMYNYLSFYSVVQGGSQAVFRILFGLFPIFLFNGLIAGTVMAQILLVLFLSIVVFGIKKWKPIVQIKFEELACTIRKYKNFIIFDTPSNILSFAAFNLPIIILSEYFNKEEIGCYSIILQLLLIPMSFIGSAMGKVYYQQLCKQSISESHIKESTSIVIRITMLISIIPMLVLALGGDRLLPLFLGQQWQKTSSIALCLSLWSFPIILTQPLLPIFKYTNKLQVLFAYESVYSFCAIGVIYAGCCYGLSLLSILILYSIAVLVIKMLLFYRIVRQSYTDISMVLKPSVLWIVTILLLAIRLYFT